jgi:hypothetical protein
MPRAKDAGPLLVPAAVAAVAVVCCAALPPLAGALTGLALATALGVGGGLLALIAAFAAIAIVVRARRRRSCPPSDQRPAP